MTDGLEELMQEPAGGPNHGRRRAPDNGANVVWQELGDAQAQDFRNEGGWTVVYEQYGARAGVHAHRGVLHPDEHVDAEALRPLIEAELGFTYDQVRSVYRRGRFSDDQRELRARIDARLLALSRSGTNLAALGKALGFKVERDSHCEPMDNALARAKAEEAKP